MPAPGDQHQTRGIATNPFEEPEHRISTYTAEQIASLQVRLNRFLGPEYISTRDGPGGKKVHYIAAVQCIQLANEIFGFNGWSSSIRDTQIDVAEENATTGKFNIAVSVTMRVTLRDGTYHEDIGYGQIENCKSKAVGFEKAKKEATTDGLKRALRNFGNVLGNCIYDKEYTSKVTKIKVKPQKYNIEDLHRHVDYATTPKQEATLPSLPTAPTSVADVAGARRIEPTASNTKPMEEDDFDGADFDDVDFSMAEEGHPDEVVVDEPLISNHFAANNTHTNSGPMPRSNFQTRPAGIQQQQQQQQQQGSVITRNGSLQPNPNTHGQGVANNSRSLPQQTNPAMQNKPSFAVPNPPNKATAAMGGPHNNPSQHQNHQAPTSVGSRSASLASPAANPPSRPTLANPTSAGKPTEQVVSSDAPPVFLSARAATMLKDVHGVKPAATAIFNPQAESPSIRKTAGIDHSKSMKLHRDHVLGKEENSAVPPPQPPIMHPSLEGIRRIGMPPNATSPVANRSSYKPPSKRPLDTGISAGVGQGEAPRTPLNDVTSLTSNIGPTHTPPDPKRQRVDNPTTSTVTS